jgi:hypothetical protein
MGVVAVKLPSILISICGILVIPLVLFSSFKLVTADYGGRPKTGDLAKEFSRIHEAIGGRTEHINKPTFRGISASFPAKDSDRRELLARFSSVAETNKWERVQSASVAAKFCKDRLSLTLEVVDDSASPYAEYAIYWAADEASFLYCGPRKAQ